MGLNVGVLENQMENEWKLGFQDISYCNYIGMERNIEASTRRPSPD